jgi:hypothetical protein
MRYTVLATRRHSPAGDVDHHSPAAGAFVTIWWFWGQSDRSGTKLACQPDNQTRHSETTMNDSGPKQPPDDELESAFLVPKNFRFGPVTAAPARSSTGLSPRAQRRRDDGPTPSLGPLAKFTRTFSGEGFNTIFLPHLVDKEHQDPDDPGGRGDHVLQLNRTCELLSFTDADKLAKVPNRGMVQSDIFFAGVAYLQTIRDVTGLDPTKPGIHFEPGLWMNVDKTEAPSQGPTLMRMASIPHGTTILAQGTSSERPGPPVIPEVSIAPVQFDNHTKTVTKFPDPKSAFPSLDASKSPIARLPQDLSDFVTAGTITQEMLDNPNGLLQKRIKSQDITSTITIDISTEPASPLFGLDAPSPLFGGGADNMAFLLGDNNPDTQTEGTDAHAPNAQTLGMKATFWIETLGDNSTQIQYSQQVFLGFNGLIWPHVSVATLTPGGASEDR